MLRGPRADTCHVAALRRTLSTALLALCVGAGVPAVADASSHARHRSGCARSSSSHRARSARRGRVLCPRHPRREVRRRTIAAALRPAAACTDTTLQPSEANLDAVRAATLCLVNRERTSRGERALRDDPHLQRAAQGHSESMADNGYFEHVGPGGDTPVDRMRAAGYIYSSSIGYEVGENIAFGTLWEATPAAIVAAWMASPGHRENILDPNYRDTGVGIAPHVPAALGHGQAGALYTQDFGVIITG